VGKKCHCRKTGYGYLSKNNVFDNGFDKNNPKVMKEKVWKKIGYG